MTATDANNATGQAAYTLQINAAPVTVTVSSSAGALTAGQVSSAYSQSFSASGGTGPYSYSVTSGSLPAGLSLSSGGALTGTPTTAGSSSFTVTATDANNATGQAAYTLQINAASVTVTVSPSAGALTAGQVSSAYSQSFSASGGTGPYSYSVTSGSLPAGLSLSSGGALTGTPTTAGSSSFTVTATDASNATGQAAYTLQINAAPVTAVITLSPASGELTKAMAGEQYTQPIKATGGIDAVTFRLVSGTMPKGMVLNVSTGELTGPLEGGTEGDYTFVLEARDNAGNIATGSYSLKVTPRVVTVTDKQMEVPPGSTPVDVPLHRGATGGPFVSAEKTFVDPPNAGVANVVQGTFAQATATAPVGWYLQFTPNPNYSGQVRVGFRLTSALGISNTGTVTYSLSFNKAKVAAQMNGYVRGFVGARQNLLASTVKVPDLMKRRRLGAANDLVTTRVQPSERGMTLGFSTSLAQIDAARNGADSAPGVSMSPFNIWIDGTLMAHTDKDKGDRWGSFAMISAGADYLVSDKLLIGVSWHYDRMTDPVEMDADLSGNGWLAGPYTSLEIGKGVFWNANLLYGGSSNDIDTEFWDGGFDTRRWLFDSSINGEWRLNEDTVLAPKLQAVYLSETVSDYAIQNNRNDTLSIKGFTAEQLRVSFGAELSREFQLESGAVLTPSIGGTGGYSGLDGSGAFGQLSAGLSLNTETMLTLDFDLLFNIENDGDRSAGARARIGGRF